MVTMISILVFFGCKRAMCHFMVTMVSFWSFLVGNVPFHRHRVFWSFWSKVELVLVFFGGQCAISSSPGILVFLEQGGIDFGLFWWTVGHFIVTEYFGLFGARWCCFGLLRAFWSFWWAMVILVDEFWSFLENQPLPCVKVAYPLNTFWSGGQCAISSSVFSGANQPLPCVKVAYPLNTFWSFWWAICYFIVTGYFGRWILVFSRANRSLPCVKVAYPLKLHIELANTMVLGDQCSWLCPSGVSFLKQFNL